MISEFIPNARVDKAYKAADLLDEFDFDNLAEVKEVSFKHILSSLDVHYEWMKASDFYSSSESGKRKVKGKSLHPSDYLKNIEDLREKIRSELEKKHISYQLITDKTSLDSYLTDLSWEMKI